MKKAITALTLGMLVTGLSYAQTAPSGSGSSNLAGSVSSAPYKIPSSKVINFIASRFHTINIDEKIQSMSKNGQTTYSGQLAISVEGALLYNNSVNVDNDVDTEITGKNIGMQVASFKIDALADGSHSIKVSGLAFKNMNAMRNQVEASDIFKILNEVDFLTIKLDKNSSFSDLSTFSLTLADLNSKIALASSKSQKSYLAVTGGGSAGWDWYRNLPSGTLAIGEQQAFRTSGNAGLEVNVEGKSNRLNIKGSWEASQSQRSYDQTSFRKSQYVNLSLDASKLMKRPVGKTPVRLGFLIKSNLGLNDKITMEGQPAIDMTQHVKQKGSVGLYLNF